MIKVCCKQYAIIVEDGLLHCLCNGKEIPIPDYLIDLGNSALKLFNWQYANRDELEFRDLDIQIHTLLESSNDIEKVK